MFGLLNCLQEVLVQALAAISEPIAGTIVAEAVNKLARRLAATITAWRPSYTLRQKLFHDMSVHVGQPPSKPVVIPRQPRVIEAEQVQYRRVKVV